MCWTPGFLKILLAGGLGDAIGADGLDPQFEHPQPRQAPQFGGDALLDVIQITGLQPHGVLVLWPILWMPLSRPGPKAGREAPAHGRTS